MLSLYFTVYVQKVQDLNHQEKFMLPVKKAHICNVYENKQTTILAATFLLYLGWPARLKVSVKPQEIVGVVFFQAECSV